MHARTINAAANEDDVRGLGNADLRLMSCLTGRLNHAVKAYSPFADSKSWHQERTVPFAAMSAVVRGKVSRFRRHTFDFEDKEVRFLRQPVIIAD